MIQIQVKDYKVNGPSYRQLSETASRLGDILNPAIASHYRVREVGGSQKRMPTAVVGKQ
jgi:hypothetical protein